MRSLTMKNPLFKEPTPTPSEEASSSRESQLEDEEIAPAAHTNAMNGVLTMESSIATSRSTTRRSNLIQLARVVAAETIGTFILMFSVCGIIAVTQIMRGQVGLLEYAATGGLSVAVVIFSVGSISGAHVNPSVTIAYAILGEFPWSMVPLYILAQMAGSAIATYVGKLVYGMNVEMMRTRPLEGRRSTAFWAELIATFIVMFLAASISSHRHKAFAYLSGFILGIAIALAILITGPVSGGSLNPARSFGPALISWKFDDIWLYIFAPTLGAVAATLLFRLLRHGHRPSSSSAAAAATPCGSTNPSVN